MSEANHIRRVYEEKMCRVLKALHRMPKEPITLSPGAIWVCIEHGLHPFDAERVLAEAQNELEESFPRTLSDGAAKLLTQVDLGRLFSGTGPENVVWNAIAFQNMAFLNSDPGARAFLRAHNEALSEQAVQAAIEYRNHCRRKNGGVK
jgi:hypothetical protein